MGGAPLVNAIAQTAPGGVVTACGLAASPDLPATVLPFILRGVVLAGIDSVGISPETRRAAWTLLAERCPIGVVERMTERIIGLDEVPCGGRGRARRPRARPRGGGPPPLTPSPSWLLPLPAVMGAS